MKEHPRFVLHDQRDTWCCRSGPTLPQRFQESGTISGHSASVTRKRTPPALVPSHAGRAPVSRTNASNTVPRFAASVRMLEWRSQKAPQHRTNRGYLMFDKYQNRLPGKKCQVSDRDGSGHQSLRSKWSVTDNWMYAPAQVPEADTPGIGQFSVCSSMSARPTIFPSASSR